MSGTRPVGTSGDGPEQRARLAAMLEAKSHREAVRYGLLLARHVLGLADVRTGGAIREGLEVCEGWLEGRATVWQARQAAFALHRLAREEANPIHEKVLRVMGQVAAIPHVNGHALAASDYAVKLAGLLFAGDSARAGQERPAQIELLRQAAEIEREATDGNNRQAPDGGAE